MTDASWAYPTLGFDPLPGDPAVVVSLKEDARIFGDRMTEQAKALRHLAHREWWQGEAAEAFAAHLDTLPRDLERCGDAFSDLAIALGDYHEAFIVAKAKATDLERRAAEAKQALHAADLAFNTPVIQAPGDCPPPRDRGPLDAAEDTLGAILREAHKLADTFDDSPEVQKIATAIRGFSEFAPDEPRFNILKRWAGTVFKATPIGAAFEAVQAVHGLINHFAEFFSDLADFMSDLSTVLGILTLPLLFVPPVGTAVAVAALATAAGSATLKTSLYVGKARDANGNLYVSGGELVRSVGDVAINAVGIGASAGAAKVVSEVPTTFGKELAGQVGGKMVRQAAAAPKEIATLGRELGVKATAKLIAKDTARVWTEKQGADLILSAGGVALTVGGPLLTATESHNYFGWRSAQHFTGDLRKVFEDAPNTPDLQPEVPPRFTAGETSVAPPTIGPAPPQPVMGR